MGMLLSGRAGSATARSTQDAVQPVQIAGAAARHFGEPVAKESATPGDQPRKAAVSPKAAAPAGDKDLLGSLLAQREAALRSSAKALQRYKDASAATEDLIKEKHAAEKLQEDAVKKVQAATLKVREAKGKRLLATRVDMKRLPTDGDHDLTAKAMAAAGAKVGTAEKALLAAARSAALEEKKVKKAAVKVEKALEEQAKAEEEVKTTRAEADKLAAAVAREDKRLKVTVANLRKVENTVNAALKKHLSEKSKGLPKVSKPSGKAGGKL